MLAYVGSDNRIAFCQPVQLLDQVLRHNHLIRVLVGERRVLFPLFDLLPPTRQPSFAGFARSFGQHVEHLLNNALSIADDWNMSTNILADRSGIDVDVNDLGIWSELFERAGHSVVESNADRDDQV